MSGEELAPTSDSGFQLARPRGSGGHLAGHLGSLGGRRLAFGVSWEGLGGVLGGTGVALETLLGVLEFLRRALGSIWGSFGSSVGNLGGL